MWGIFRSQERTPLQGWECVRPSLRSCHPSARCSEKGARRILGNSFTLMLIVSVILTIFFLLTKEYLLSWFGASEVTFPYADSYMTIYTAGTVFALLSMGMNYFITAQGFPLLGMMTTLIGAVINIVLDPVFIFLFHMDIAGAAVATVIAQTASCVFVLCTLRRKKMKIPLVLMRPERRLGIQIVKIGFSPFLILATDSIIIIALNAVLQHYGGPEYGDTLVTAATIVQSYMLLITSPMLGITGGSQPLISFNYGANRDRIRKTFFWVLMLCFCFTAVMFLISRIMPQYFVRIFTDNPEYEELAVWGIELPVCDRGRTDCARNDEDVSEPFADQKVGVLRGDLRAAPVFRRPYCVLCRASGGRAGGGSFLYGIFLYIQEISAGRRASEGD